MKKEDEAKEWQGEKGMGGKGTDRQTIIFLFTRAKLGTPDNTFYKILFLWLYFG